MDIITMKLDELVPYENNPRNNDDAVGAVANSIREFGFKVPIIVDKDNVIVAGHTRLRAAQFLGLKDVPVIRADDLSEEQVRAFRLADNKTAELADWDMEKLNLELAQLSELDMAAFGFEELDDTAEAEEEAEENTTAGFNYKEQYGVIVICQDETDQERIYNELTQKGYECKVVAT